MHPSYIAYFALIPIVIFCFIWIIIRTIEKVFHRYLYHKTIIMIISSVATVVLAIAAIITSFFVG